MKIDLVTIFPSLQLETQSWEYGKQKLDPNLLDYFKFNKSELFSYLRLKSQPDLLKDHYRSYINDIRDQLIDSDGKTLNNFTIVFDKGISLEGLQTPNSDGQHILYYLALSQNLDYWLSLDFIKFICYQKRGRRIEHNNKHELFVRKYRYLLQTDQNNVHKLTVNKNFESEALTLLSVLSKKDPGFYGRVMISISLFNESCRIHPFNPNSAIVLLTSAFEALLHIPRKSKKETFSYAFKLFWGFDDRVEQWARNLYDLRNHIVHGAVVGSDLLYASQDRHYPHFKIGRGIFNDSLLLLLDTKGILRLQRDYREKVLRDLRNKVVSNMEKVSDILHDRKRFTYRAFCTNKNLYEEFLKRIESLTAIDYSAKEKMKNLLDLIFSIIEDWIKDKLKEEKQPVSSHSKKYLEFRREKYLNLSTLLDQLKKIKWTLRGRFKVEEKLRDISEELRQLEPILHKEDEIKFTLSEFGDRCLKAIWGTY